MNTFFHKNQNLYLQPGKLLILIKSGLECFLTVSYILRLQITIKTEIRFL